MSNKKRPFHQYFYNEFSPIPKATKFYHKNKTASPGVARSILSSSPKTTFHASQTPCTPPHITISPSSTSASTSSSQSPIIIDDFTDEGDETLIQEPYQDKSFQEPTYNKDEVAFAILTLFFSGKMTQTALETCVKLFNILTGQKLPQEFEDLLKILMKNDDNKGENSCKNFVKKYHCPTCEVDIEVSRDNRYQRICKNCNTRLLMFYYLDVKLQIKRIFQRQEIFQLPVVSSDGFIRDVTDGSNYRELLESEYGDKFKTGKAFSFLMNTDGISVSDSSNLTIWPVYLAINEIRPEYRFCLENLIITCII